MDVAALWAKVTRMREAVAAAEAAHAVAVFTTEASTREATVAWDRATLRIKDVENQAALVEREVLERVSWAEAKNSTALTSAHDNAEGLVQKITHLESELAEEHRVHETSEREHRECFD
jgi:hypothetical protein